MVDRVIDEALRIATENQLLKAMLRRLVGQSDLSPWGYEPSGFALDVYSGVAQVSGFARIEDSSGPEGSAPINEDAGSSIPTLSDTDSTQEESKS